MRKLVTDDIYAVLGYIHAHLMDYLVVEGYNAVGKSVVIESILKEYPNRFLVYRPDYTVWTPSLLPAEYRWSIYSSFVDIAKNNYYRPILFDRGLFSGIVYNDKDLYSMYNHLSKNSRILHVLVTCDEENYNKFLSVRKSDKPLRYEDCAAYTNKYREAFDRAGAPYIEFLNKFDDSRREYADTCAGCSHYTFHSNTCSNKLASLNGITDVSPNRERCEYSSMKEVQDSHE